MNLSSASLSYIVGMILNDLNSFLEGEEKYLSKAAKKDLIDWFDWATSNSVTAEEENIIFEEIHESLQAMAVWFDSPEKQGEVFAKIDEYFETSYGQFEEVKKFSQLVLDYYKKELQNYLS